MSNSPDSGEPERHLRFTWIKAGVISGLVAVGSYTLLIFLTGGFRVAFIAASVFSLALALAGYGLYQFLTIDRPTAVAQAAAVTTGVGAVVFLAMASIQLAVKSDLGGVDPTTLGSVFELIERVHLGLDVAWDVYFGVGMGLFGVASFTHPRMGRVLGGSGVVIAAALLVLNIVDFPIPPASAGSIDLGPVAGLWYLAVTVQIIRSLGWAKHALGIGTENRPDPARRSEPPPQSDRGA